MAYQKISKLHQDFKNIVNLIQGVSTKIQGVQKMTKILKSLKIAQNWQVMGQKILDILQDVKKDCLLRIQGDPTKYRVFKLQIGSNH